MSLARERLPHWRDRCFEGNALEWTPPRRYDFVHVGDLRYAPRNRERAFMDHLYEDCVAPGGRLILGPDTEEAGSKAMEMKARAWGYHAAGYCEKAHQGNDQLCRRMLWFDKT